MPNPKKQPFVLSCPYCEAAFGLPKLPATGRQFRCPKCAQDFFYQQLTTMPADSAAFARSSNSQMGSRWLILTAATILLTMGVISAATFATAKTEKQKPSGNAIHIDERILDIYVPKEQTSAKSKKSAVRNSRQDKSTTRKSHIEKLIETAVDSSQSTDVIGQAISQLRQIGPPAIERIDAWIDQLDVALARAEKEGPKIAMYDWNAGVEFRKKTQAWRRYRNMLILLRTRISSS